MLRASARSAVSSRALRLLPVLAYLVPVWWILGDALTGARVLYFRDISVYYVPNYAFLGDALRRGVWPLWNPWTDGGAPFLLAYPPDLLLSRLLDGPGVVAWSAALHLWLAMAGARRLARALGADELGSWVSGAVFGLSGYLLSCVNLLPLLQGAAWAPWVALALRRLAERSDAPRVAALGLALAMQISSLAAEIVLLTLAAGLVLVIRRGALSARTAVAFAGALLLAAAIAAPALAGGWALVAGTSRGGGFDLEQAAQFSASPAVLLESVWPHLFGDVHAFSDVGYWGQPFFPEGFPYLLSLYFGPTMLLLALRGSRTFERGLVVRSWVLVVAGVLFSLGAHGPFLFILAPWLRFFRAPVKFFLLVTLGLALLAGAALSASGPERAAGPTRGSRALWVLPGLGMLALAGVLTVRPEIAGFLPPPMADPRARHVVATLWPGALALSGALCLGVGLAMASGGAWIRAVPALAVLDLLAVNGTLNPLTGPEFYRLRPEVRRLLEAARDPGAARWFSYGLADTPGLTMTRPLPSDVWLYHVDRQVLVPRTNVLDGVETAFDVDRTGWAPAGATLAPRERNPSLFRAHHDKLRRAGVRWVLSFDALPDDLVTLRAETDLPPVARPLRLFELRAPLPRAYWAPAEGPAEPPVPGSDRGVAYERVGVHEIRLQASTGPGVLVLLEGFDPAWSVDVGGHPTQATRVLDRSMAIPTPGGAVEVVLRYSPRWRAPALVAMALGLGVAGALVAAAAARRARVGPEAGGPPNARA